LRPPRPRSPKKADQPGFVVRAASGARRARQARQIHFV
jgi:hypothetical protein